MGRFRTISTEYWSDCKVVDDFSKDEKYLFLYLLTGPRTNLCGCYEISKKQISFDTDLSRKETDAALAALESHNVIRYSEQTKELLILNWAKHNWSKSAGDKMRVPLKKEIDEVKNDAFREYLAAEFNGDTPSMDIQDSEDPSLEGDRSPIEGGYSFTYPNTNTISNPNTDSNTKSKAVNTKDQELTNKAKDVVAYLNQQCGTHYKDTAEGTLKHIKARLREFTVEDCYTVIDKKARDWLRDEKMRKYLRPETLFGSKFESYLNEPTARGRPNSKYAMLEQLTQESIRSDHGAG